MLNVNSQLVTNKTCQTITDHQYKCLHRTLIQKNIAEK